MRIIDLGYDEAQKYLLRSECYFRSDLPSYICFDDILRDVSSVLSGGTYKQFQKKSPNRPEDLFDVNYKIIGTKDGRFGWRPYELIHPAIYVSLVQKLCEPVNWKLLQTRFEALRSDSVECTSHLLAAKPNDGHDATQVRNWWLRYEQRSIELSLEYSHVLKTDVTNCYGSIYTHSIPWALHGLTVAKEKRNAVSLLGNVIDSHIRASRNGQTNGIPQGSVLMDLLAELVLGYVDHSIDIELQRAFGASKDYHILRYRDDYSVFTRSDLRAAEIAQIISKCLRDVGMQLGAAKTLESRSIVEASIKPEKLAAIQLEGLDTSNAKSIQKQLLRLHAFARTYPNSGALNRLADAFFQNMLKISEAPSDLRVQVAIITDISFISPRTFPALSGMLAKLILLAPLEDRASLWSQVVSKMKWIPHNGHQEIWLQRVVASSNTGLEFHSEEPICQIVNGDSATLWNNSWISNPALVQALDNKKILVGSPASLPSVPQISELSLFRKYAEFS